MRSASTYALQPAVPRPPPKPLSPDYGNQRDQFLAVLPSLDLDGKELGKVAGVRFYEERLLCNLIALANPDVEMAYLTSHQVDDAVIAYYLSLKPGASLADRLQRLSALSVHDLSPEALSSKVVAKPKLLDVMRRMGEATERQSAGLSVFASSDSAKQIAEGAKLHLLEADPEQLRWGTKAGGREIFSEVNIPHPAGVPGPEDRDLLDDRGLLSTPRALATAIARMVLSESPPGHGGGQASAPRTWMVKLNEGFSGKGNGVLDLGDPLADPQIRNAIGKTPAGDRRSAERLVSDWIEARLPQTELAAGKSTPWMEYVDQMGRLGAIAEAFLEGEGPSSPSVQGIVKPDGGVELLSTHEQILDGQVYIGCRFPAAENYRDRLSAYGSAIGKALAKRGVIGHFAADFLAVPSATHPGQWDLSALEINLRQGGTTHPQMTLRLLTDGKLGEDGIFRTPAGIEKHYVATDNLRKPEYRGMKAAEVIAALHSRSGRHIHWDPRSKTGVVFHLFGTLQPEGKVGFTAIANTPEEAARLYRSAEAFLDRLATEGRRPPDRVAG